MYQNFLRSTHRRNPAKAYVEIEIFPSIMFNIIFESGKIYLKKNKLYMFSVGNVGIEMFFLFSEKFERQFLIIFYLTKKV